MTFDRDNKAFNSVITDYNGNQTSTETMKNNREKKEKRISKPAEIRNKRFNSREKKEEEKKEKRKEWGMVVKRLEERKHERGNRLNP